jgi:hypothetical protein
MSGRARPVALGLLDVLVGEWTQEVSGRIDSTGAISFEWTLDGRYLLQRSFLPAPFPESRALIELDEDTDEFRPDFSALDFCQRYVGQVADDGWSVDGRWEASHNGGETWEADFQLRFERRP